MKVMKKKFKSYDEFTNSEIGRERKKNFPFLVDMTIAMWRSISRPIISITEMTLGSALNALIRFEISHPNSKEIQQRKDDFPFAVDMQDMWKKLMRSMNDMKILPKLTKNQLSTGDAKV
jgi:hypothetical protein